MPKEERAFLVVISIAIGTIAFFVVTIGKYLSVVQASVLGLGIALLYPVLTLVMVKISMLLKAWAYQERFDKYSDTGQETIRAYLFILIPIIFPFLVIFSLSFGILNRLFSQKSA